MQNPDTALPWVIVELNGQEYGLPASQVREMLISPPVVRVPGHPAWVTGVMNLRGRALPVIGLRERFGIVSALGEMEALCGLLEQREQDHRNWIAELEASVREKREFRLATDPHQCAFGKWYDAYRTPNLLVSNLLRQLDAPHKAVHALAAEVSAAAANGDTQGALDRIAAARESTLARLVRLFGELRGTLRDSRREIVLVLDLEDTALGLAVDGVAAVEKLRPESIVSMAGTMPGIDDRSLAGRAAKRAKDGRLVLLLETGRLAEGTPGPLTAEGQ